MEANPRRFPGLRLLAAKYLGLSFTWAEWEKHASYYEPTPPPWYDTRGCLSAAPPVESRAPGTDRALLLPPAPPGRPRSPAPAAPPAGARRGAGGDLRGPSPGLGALGGRAARLWVCCAPGTAVPGLGHGWLRGAPRGRCSRGRPGNGLPASAVLLPPCPRSGWRGRKRRCLRSPEITGLPRVRMCEVKEGGYGRGSFPAPLACSCSQTHSCCPVWRSERGSSSASPPAVSVNI